MGTESSDCIGSHLIHFEEKNVYLYVVNMHLEKLFAFTENKLTSPLPVSKITIGDPIQLTKNEQTNEINKKLNEIHTENPDALNTFGLKDLFMVVNSVSGKKTRKDNDKIEEVFLKDETNNQTLKSIMELIDNEFERDAFLLIIDTLYMNQIKIKNEIWNLINETAEQLDIDNSEYIMRKELL